MTQSLPCSAEELDEDTLMLFMVIERFENDDMVPIYDHLRASGRGMPEGMRFVGSWVEAGFGRCFQLVEADEVRELQEWVLHWRGLRVRFEIVPVVSGSEEAELVEPLLSGLETGFRSRA